MVVASHQAQQEVEISAPIGIAFEALTDYERLAEWQSAIDELAGQMLKRTLSELRKRSEALTDLCA